VKNALNMLRVSSLWLGGLIVVFSGWLIGVSIRRDAAIPAALPSFSAAIEGYFAVHQVLPSSELIAWDDGSELFVLLLDSEKSAAVALPVSPYGGQMGYRPITDRRYELWAVGPHGPVLMSETELHKEGG
jgi:hypothetical protein